MKCKDFFRGLLEYKRQIGCSDKTIGEYHIHLYGSLSHSISEIDIENLKLTDVAKVIEAGRAHGRFGPQRSVVVLRQLLKYIKASGHQLNFDWRDIKLPAMPRKKVEWLEPDELEKVRACFDLNSLIGLRDRALIELLYVSGMRISEALSLNREDIDWDKKEAVITNCKTKERETVYFNDESLRWLKRYLDMRNDKFPPLFVSVNGRRCSPCAIRRTLNSATKNANIKKHIHPHLFRSTFCTTLLHGGVDIQSVKVLARHKSERTTLRHYIAVSAERCKTEHGRVMNGLVT